MDFIKTTIYAYLFPATLSDVKERMSAAELPEGTSFDCRLGENGVVLEVCTPVEDAVKAQIKELFGTAVYSFETEDLAEVVVKKLLNEKKRIAVAESCTGGLLSKRITDVPGASAVYELGMTVYSNEAKTEILNVSEKTIGSHGAVSRETAEELAKNMLTTADADIGVSITGCAGPDGSEEKPVGLVYIGIATKDGITVERLELGENKSRDKIRKETALFALCMINRVLGEDAGAVLAPLPEEESIVPTTFFGKARGWVMSALRYIIPWKGDPVKEMIRKSVFLVAICVFLGSGIYIGNYFLSRLAYDRQIEGLQTLTQAEPTEEELANLPSGYLKKFASLYAINPDVAGWIKVGDTIDLPVVKPEDNDYYLKKDFYKKDNYHGIPFMDYRCSPRLTTTNTIIYGHNVTPDRMFAPLLNYRRLAFYRENPTFTYDSVYEESTWKVLYVMIVDSESDRGEYFPYHNFINAANDSEFYNFIEECKKRTIINTTVDVNPTDTLLTLSTCGFDFAGERVVIVARKVRYGESETVDVNHAVANPKVLMPDIWYSIWGGTKPSFDDTSSDTSSEASSDTSSEESSQGRPEFDPSVDTTSGSSDNTPSTDVSDPPQGGTESTPSGGGTEILPPDEGDEETGSSLPADETESSQPAEDAGGEETTPSEDDVNGAESAAP